MLKKCLAFFVLSIFVFLVCGCGTLAGTAVGAAVGAAKGAQADWEATKKADQWFRENLW